MKLSKLSMAAAAVFATGAVMADPVDVNGFEGVQSGGVYTLQTGSSDVGDMADGEIAGSHWFTAQASEDTLITPYGEAAKYEGTAWPETFATSHAGDYFLKVSNNTPLFRTFKTFGKVNNAWPTTFPETALDNSAIGVDINTALYIDTLVQFTPSEETPSVSSDHDKLVVYMNSNGKLCVKALVLEGYDYGTATEFVTDKDLVAGTWYRLTVKALPGIWTDDGTSPNFPAFLIYIDGEQVTSTTKTVTAAAIEEAKGDDALDADTEALINAGKLFASLQLCNYGESRLEAVGVKGEGAIDDFVVSYTEPDFSGQEPTALDFTLTWGEGVSAVWYAINGGAEVAAVSGQKVTDVAANAVVTLRATPATWYAIDAATTNDLTVSAADTTRMITATEVATGGEAGVADTLLASWTPDQIKAAFGNTVTPEELNAADYPYYDYQYGQDLGTLESEPNLKITKIEEGEDGWEITVSAYDGENAVSIENGSALKLRAALKVKASETLAGLATATADTYDFDFDATATDVVITIPALDGNFFRATVEYAPAPVVE